MHAQEGAGGRQCVVVGLGCWCQQAACEHPAPLFSLRSYQSPHIQQMAT